MSRSRFTTTDDISSLSDAQLREFMEKHRRSDGVFELDVANDWNKLSEGDRNRLAERLQCISAASRSLDLDNLDALLRGVCIKDNSVSGDRPQESKRRTESPDETDQEIYQREEIEAYNNLVHDGGRALYRIDLIDSVSKDPDVYRDMLAPFWRQPRYDKPSELDHSDARAVFRRQWHRWQNFRKWQLDNRKIEDDDDGFLAFVEKAKRDCQEVGDLKGVAEIEADPTILKQRGEPWYYIQRHRNWQRRYQRELGCETISDYEKAVKARLARHGFNLPFHLIEDPKQQDKLTEWIEYLGFEYWWLDRYTVSMERLKPKHDEAWDELKKLRMVRDDETPEFIRTDASGTRCQREEDHAQKTLQDAESEAKMVYQKTQKDPNRLNISEQLRVEMLRKARKRLLAARESLEFTERRSDSLIDFVRSTFGYANAKEDVANQANLVNWVMEEVHAIEAEQKSLTLQSSSQKKRKASVEDVCSGQLDPKRQKCSSRKHSWQPSKDKIGTGDGRVLRRRNRPSTDINRQFNQHQSRNIHDTYPSQTKLVRPAVEQVPFDKAEPESL
ncbi:hypothetical protein MAC_06920 [Metarhizium acridum CQMa 102]|uniref:Ankyrin 2,3/unc44 n=2 Tax=Metarhizium acridum TaxID=92637 RepID=E9EAM2_METAQ|nr:uncharacterized protein MAC_06920 [Metarhizium acridum CQMa 102]EFY87022.1 hypothetical protein MAC_06920 [Metarhizium acridum CQMa 102]